MEVKGWNCSTGKLLVFASFHDISTIKHHEGFILSGIPYVDQRFIDHDKLWVNGHESKKNISEGFYKCTNVSRFITIKIPFGKI